MKRKSVFIRKHRKVTKNVKFFAKKFGGKEKLPTFAIPNENKTFETTFPNSSVG